MKARKLPSLSDIFKRWNDRRESPAQIHAELKAQYEAGLRQAARAVQAEAQLVGLGLSIGGRLVAWRPYIDREALLREFGDDPHA